MEKLKKIFLIFSLFFFAIFIVSAILLFPRLKIRIEAHIEDKKIQTILEDKKTENKTIENQEENKDLEFKNRIGELKKINNDLVGIIHIPSVDIKEPIVQGKDNYFYLKHLFSKKRNNLGAIFLDVNNKKDFSDNNSVIYGHRVRSGLMFQNLIKFKKKDFFDNNKDVYIYTDKGVLHYEIFAVLNKEASFPYRTLNFNSSQEMQEYFINIRQNSRFNRDIDLLAYSHPRVIALSTCDYDFQNQRLVVFANLVDVKTY